MGASVAQADQVTTDADSAAHGHFVWLEGLGIDVAGGASTITEFDAEPGPTNASLNLEALEAVELSLGNLTLPLLSDGESPGLLSLGSAGLLESYSASPSSTESNAASGLITAEGGINFDAADDPAFAPASIDLTSLFSQLGIDGLTDDVLDEATFELGALASEAQKTGPDQSSQYMLSNAEMALHSPALDDVVGAVDEATGAAGAALDGLVGSGGAISAVVQTAVNALQGLSVVGLSISVADLGIDTTGLVDSVREELLQTPINNAATADGPASINIDLSTGTISVNVEDLLIGPGGVYEGLTLSTLPANADLLSDDVLNSIVSGVTDALTGTGPNSLTTKATDLLTQGIYSLALDLNIQATAPILGTTNITLEDSAGNPGTLGGVLGIDGYPAADLEVSGGVLGAVGGLVTPILSTLLTGLGNAVQPVVDTAVTNLSVVLNAALQPLITALTGEDALFKEALDQVATFTVNAQPGSGDFGEGSFTVRALDLQLLPGVLTDPVNLQLASSTVTALDEAAATLTGTPNPVEQGGTVTLTGDGFDPGEDVTVTFPDGTTTTVTAEEDGTISTTWDVPADQELGDVTFTAVGGTSGQEATATVTVEAAAVDATLTGTPNPVEQGGTVTLT
ncbi:choice-of-anchor G family protein, partial [Leucobacter tardus]